MIPMENEIMEGLKEVLKMIRPTADLDGVTPDSRLLEDLGMDSLTMLLMSLGIENKFNMKFDDKVQLNTVRDVIDCVIKSK